MFEAAPQWLAEKRVNVKWKPISVSSDMERKISICLRVQQMSVSPAVAPLCDVPKVVQSLYQLTNSIQWEHSPTPTTIVEGQIEFPAQNGECFKNFRTRIQSLSERKHGCLILPRLEDTECASYERATQHRDFSRIAAGKTIFLHLLAPTESRLGLR